MSLKGDFAKLATLQAKVRKIADGSILERLGSVLGATSVAQAQLGFRGSVDPYGSAWESLKKREGKPLLLTGRLRSSFSYKVFSKGWSVDTNAAYAGAHQYGVDKTVSRTVKEYLQAVDARGRFTRVGKPGRDARGKFLKRGAKVAGYRKMGGKHEVRMRLPQRMMLPISSRGLGPIWNKALNEATRRFLRSKYAQG